MSIFDKLKDAGPGLAAILGIVDLLARSIGVDPREARKEVGEWLLKKAADSTDPLAVELQKLMDE